MDEHQRAFHLAEYQQLHVEIDEMMKGCRDVMRTALLGSGAVFAWIATNGVGSGQCVAVAQGWTALIPAVLAAIGGVVTFVAFERVGAMGRYLRELERMLGHESLGWESRLTRAEKWPNRMVAAFWAALLVANLMVGISVSADACAIKSERPSVVQTHLSPP